MQSPQAGGGVQGQMARGAVWMVLFKLLERSIGLVSTLILARVLIPADFGIVAMAMTFIAMAELLTAFGFDIALIQNRGASEDDYNTAWTGNLLLGMAIMLAMLAAAVPISRASIASRNSCRWWHCWRSAPPSRVPRTSAWWRFARK